MTPLVLFIICLFKILHFVQPAPVSTPATCNAPHTKTPVTIDGKGAEAVWAKAAWQPLDQTWIGQPPSPQDFQGRYKLAWDANYLYLLAEITDDTLIDINPNPVENYWDDDCLEVFIDEDASGGPHRNSHNAFAYHIALDGRVADYGLENKAILLDHVRSARITRGKVTTWECAIAIYNDRFDERQPDNSAHRLRLKAGKVMGFALAYCDNDHSPGRENFIGSIAVAGEDKNQGYRTADIFGRVKLLP